MYMMRETLQANICKRCNCIDNVIDLKKVTKKYWILISMFKGILKIERKPKFLMCCSSHPIIREKKILIQNVTRRSI